MTNVQQKKDQKTQDDRYSNQSSPKTGQDKQQSGNDDYGQGQQAGRNQTQENARKVGGMQNEGSEQDRNARTDRARIEDPE